MELFHILFHLCYVLCNQVTALIVILFILYLKLFRNKPNDIRNHRVCFLNIMEAVYFRRTSLARYSEITLLASIAHCSLLFTVIYCSKISFLYLNCFNQVIDLYCFVSNHGVFNSCNHIMCYLFID